MVLEEVKAAVVTLMRRADSDDVNVPEVLVPSGLVHGVKASTSRLAQALLPERQATARMPPVESARGITVKPVTLLAIGVDSVRAVLMLVLGWIQHAQKLVVKWRIHQCS